ncbi:MAG: hypothetical protein U1F53_05400 [Burkholderiaceae bacterium]
MKASANFFIRASAAACLAAAAGVAVPTQAAVVLGEQALSPQARLQAHQQLSRERRAALGAGGQLDSMPPTLNRFTVEGDVDAQAALPSATLNLSLTDDLSGLQTWIINLVGPSGQMVQRVEGISTGQRRLDGRVSVGAAPVATVPLSRYSEPGVWTVDSVFVSDAAYNMRIYDHDALAAMGRASFTVRNDGGYDKLGPRLLAGRIETKRVSLSTPPPGTWEGTLPTMSVGLRVVDDGNTAVAGPQDAIAAFCLPDRYGNCVDRFELQGHVNEVGRRSASLRLGGQPRADQTPGRYILYYVFLSDLARNATVLTTSVLGGETDFSALFPTTTLTIDP